jgi:hypothetical protein
MSIAVKKSQPCVRQAWRILAVVALLACAGGASADEPAASELAVKPLIGRVFFSPEARQSATLRAAEGQKGGPLPPAPKPDQKASLRVDGIVTNSLGQRRVWINGAAVLRSESSFEARSDRQGRVWLTRHGDAARDVQTGQTLTEDGTIVDVVPHGAITQR